MSNVGPSFGIGKTWNDRITAWRTPSQRFTTSMLLTSNLASPPSGVGALVDRCEKLRLLERRPGRVDQRIVEVRLLLKGERLLAKIAALHQDGRRALLRELAAANAPNP